MILETGSVVAVELGGIWVETIQRSACGSCQAQKGCGHSALAKWGASASRLWVVVDSSDNHPFNIGDQVTIGIPEDVVAAGSLFIYLLPLMFMLGGTLLAHHQQLGDGLSALYALVGLFIGAVIVRFRSNQLRFDKRLQPVLVDVAASVSAVNLCELK